MPALIDLTRRRFGRLVVLSRSPEASTKPKWLCRCDCGNTSVAYGPDLKSGRHGSCGCLHREKITRHGWINTPTYRSWQSMIQRCTNESSTGYDGYGGRGISVCDRWREFTNFLADMGERPSIAHTLDRFPDKNGHYQPGNCRWGTKIEQANNTNRNLVVSYRGESMTVTELSRQVGVDFDTLRSRLRLGWSTEDAVELPIGHYPKYGGPPHLDMAGVRCGKLLVIQYAGSNNKRAYWECQCECGNKTTAMGKELRQGRVVSCGCKRGQPQAA